MIYPTRRAALRNAHHGERAEPVISRWKRCELGCACIPCEPKRIGWVLIFS